MQHLVLNQQKYSISYNIGRSVSAVCRFATLATNYVYSEFCMWQQQAVAAHIKRHKYFDVLFIKSKYCAVAYTCVSMVHMVPTTHTQRTRQTVPVMGWRVTRSARGVVVCERGGDVASPPRIFTMKNEIMKTDVTNFHIRLKYYANKCEYIPVMETPFWNGFKGWECCFVSFMVRAMSGPVW